MSNQPNVKKTLSKSTLAQLRTLHNDQLAKIQTKHQNELDLIDDVRNFLKQRSIIEKEYGQAMLRLVGGYLSKKDSPQTTPIELPSEVASQRGVSGRAMSSAWRSLLEAHDTFARQHLELSEQHLYQSSEPLRIFRVRKTQLLKRSVDQLKWLQAESAAAVSELCKLQRGYAEVEHETYETRHKCAELEEKLKKKSGGLFSSKESMQKSSAKLSNKRDALELKSITARNEYLLGLAASNSQHSRLIATDLPDLIKLLECDVHERLRDSLLGSLSREQALLESTRDALGRLVSELSQCNRAYQLECFLNEHAALFREGIQFTFEPTDGDPISYLMGNQNDLEIEAKQICMKVAKDDYQLESYEHQLENSQAQLAALGQAGTNSARGSIQNVNGGAAGGESSSSEAQQQQQQQQSTMGVAQRQAALEAQADELRCCLQRVGHASARGHARLALFRQYGLPVEEMLARAKSEYLEQVKQQQQQQLLAQQQYQQQQQQLQAQQQQRASIGSSPQRSPKARSPPSQLNGTAPAQSPETAAMKSVSSANSLPVQPPVFKPTHLVKFDFAPTNHDELAVSAGERVEEVMDAAREAEWLNVRNEAGATGLVPRAYVDSLASSPAGQSTDSGSGAAGGVSGSAAQWTTGPSDPYAQTSWGDDATADLPVSAPRAQQQSPQRASISAQPSSASSVAAPDWSSTRAASFSRAAAGASATAAGEDVYANMAFVTGVAESLSASSTPLPTPGPASEQPLTTSDSSRSLDNVSILSKFNIVKVLYEYESQSPDELELSENDQLLVLESADEEAEDGFCFGRVLHVSSGSGALAIARVGRTGFFPSVMVEPLGPNELQKLAGVLGDSSASAAGSSSAAGASGLKDTLSKWVAELKRAKQTSKGEINGNSPHNEKAAAVLEDSTIDSTQL